MKMNRETWKFILQTVMAVLSAIATSLGVSSCMKTFI
ncbi:MAG: smalltalk protein [Prevotella sp.]|nr:smalltalk protein [Prevotella sp.]